MSRRPRTGGTLAVRLDSLGDVLVTSPALRAIRGGATLLCGPSGAHAAPFLPGVRDAIVWRCPWIDLDTPAPDWGDDLVARLAARRFDEAIVFTSFHQSALPTALLLRRAGIARIGAYSEDYPGALLDVRLPDPGDIPEPERAVALARACGHASSDTDPARLALHPSATRAPLPAVVERALQRPSIVVHPGASAASRRPPARLMRAVVAGLADSGWSVIVTGTASERALVALVADGRALDTAGALGFAGLATVISRSAALVSGNTGPAHVAAAVGTPVVSLFSPVVPAGRWLPYGVPVIALGDASAPCASTRARECTVPGHPCLASVPPSAVLDAVALLASDAGTATTAAVPIETPGTHDSHGMTEVSA